MFKIVFTVFITALIISAVIMFFMVRRDTKREIEALKVKGIKLKRKKKV